MMRRLRRWLTTRDDGQLSILVVGFFVIVSVLVLGGIDVTAAQLTRVRLLDAADAIALDAADALDESGAYDRGLDGSVAVSAATVREAAAESLAARPFPSGIVAWGLSPGTGSPDGASAVVALTGTANLPISGPILDALGGEVTITVTSRARAVLQ